MVDCEWLNDDDCIVPSGFVDCHTKGHCIQTDKIKDIIKRLTRTEWNVELTPEEYFIDVCELKKELGID